MQSSPRSRIRAKDASDVIPRRWWNHDVTYRALNGVRRTVRNYNPLLQSEIARRRAASVPDLSKTTSRNGARELRGSEKKRQESR